MTTTTRRPDSPPPAAAPENGGAPDAPYVDRPTLVWRSAQTIVRVWTTLWFDLKVFGIRNIPRSGGVLIVSNHQGNLDPLILGARVPRPMSFMAKSELFRNRAFAWLIRGLGAFPVRQGTADVRAIKETVQRLQEGRMLNIFPEGSRTVTGEINPMEPGAALVVRKAGVPIVPAAIVGSFEAWPKGKRLFRRHPVRIVFGPPLDVTGMKGERVIRVIDAAIRQLFERLRSGRMNDDLAAQPLQLDVPPAARERRR